MASKVKFYYGSHEFDLPADQADVLDDYNGEAGTISINLGNGSWLKFATGPGIPMAVETWDEAPAVRVSRIR